MKRAVVLATVCFVASATLSFSALASTGGSSPEPPRKGDAPILRTYDGDIPDTAAASTPAVGLQPGAEPCAGFHKEMEAWLKLYAIC